MQRNKAKEQSQGEGEPKGYGRALCSTSASVMRNNRWFRSLSCDPGSCCVPVQHVEHVVIGPEVKTRCPCHALTHFQALEKMHLKRYGQGNCGRGN